MPWLIDGSNVLGARRTDPAQRELVRLLVRFARAKKTRVTCVFDGQDPGSFHKSLGALTVVFSGSREADDVIIERAAHGRGWIVVTADRVLIARIQRRDVRVVAPGALLREAGQVAAAEPDRDEDWDSYFSNQENRLKF